MAICVTVIKIEENKDSVVYKYSSNRIDWGEFRIVKGDFDTIFNIKLEKDDDNKRFSFRAHSAVRRDFLANNAYPDGTCFAA
jgi:hypothetical protein